MSKNISYYATLLDHIEKSATVQASKLVQKKYGLKLGKNPTKAQRAKIQALVDQDYDVAYATFRRPKIRTSIIVEQI